MQAQIKKGHYVIAAQDKEGRQPYLMKVLDVDRHEIHGVVEKFCHIESLRTTVSTQPDYIMVNLGENPMRGTVYGVDVSSRFVARRPHDTFGTINFFYKPKKEIGAALMLACDRTYKILKSAGLEFLLNDLIWEVHPKSKSEKYAGRYMRGSNKILPIIQLKPEVMTPEFFVYVLLHELGHHLHLHYANRPKLNALWIRAFNTSIKVATVKKETSQLLLDGLLSQQDNPSDFKSTLAEEEALAYKWILRTIQSVHGLSVKELDFLFEAGMLDDIKKLWPVRTIPRKELEPIVSEYATKNYKELFAETFAFYFTKKKLPEPLKRLLEKSMSYAKSNREKSDD